MKSSSDTENPRLTQMNINAIPKLFVGCTISLLASFSHADNWPTWRGPELTGVASDADLPVRWTKTDNVRWRVDLPGPGNSSPIVWGDRVFVSQSIAAEKRRTLMCFDRANGDLLWQAGITYTGEEPTHETNPHCAGTPATDGERIYVCFGAPGVYAYDFAGNELWHAELGKLSHIFGTAVSTILYGDLCILNFGPGEEARLVALDKKSGETVWEAAPPAVDPSELAPPGGFGRGPGAFGPGMFLAPAMFAEADGDGDLSLTQSEFVTLAESWFDKLDPSNSGQINQDQFAENLQEVLPSPGGGRPRPNAGDEGAGGRPRGGFGPGRFIGPGLFDALDADKNKTLTLAEMKGSFTKWHEQWAGDDKSISEDQLRDGLTAVLPQPNFGGPGRPPGPEGPGRGPGGPGGPGGGRGRPGGGPGGPGGFQFGGSWSTPIIVRSDGRDELIVAFPARVVAYDPNSGDQLWMSKGIGGTIYTTPVASGSLLVAMSSGMGGGNAVAVRGGGSGDVTDTHRVWRLDRTESPMGSGVVHDGHFYTISQDGIAACRNLVSGTEVWKRRLRGSSSSRGGAWSSMLLSGDKIYVPNQSGDVFVLAASPAYELLATNSIDEPTNASLAASDGELFMRTDAGLWCIGAKQETN
jgi:outer membrane protein assembly factor BamB